MYYIYLYADGGHKKPCRTEKCGRHFRLIFFFGLEQDWRTFLSVCAQTADEFRRNSIACGKQNLLMPHFRLFQWCIITVIGWRLGQQPGWPASGKQKIFL